jgi:hypothetical protein
MLQLQHSIRRQTLDIEIASEALALALQARLPDVNRRAFLPLIERVFEEFTAPHRHIKIKSLNIDLGSIPFASFEQVAVERLERELRRALKEAIRDLEEGRATEDALQSEAMSRLELLEHYLLYGTLPFWASSTTNFSLEEFILELAEDDPAGLAGVIRRHGRRTYVLERLVLQLGDETLGRLLRLLEPEHAALIIFYMTDLLETHRVEPVLALGDRQFARLLWLVVLTYCTREAGTHFNRKSFLKSLLQGMAESEKLEYEDLLMVLRLSLRETEKIHPLKSSLLIIIGELSSDLAATRAKNLAQASMRAAHDQLTQALTHDEPLREEPPQEEPPRDELPPGHIAEALAARAKVPADSLAEMLKVQLENIPTKGDAEHIPTRDDAELLLTRDDVKLLSSRDDAGLGQVREAFDGLLSDRALWDWQVVQTFERHDRVEVLRYYLRYGMLPWGALLRDSELDARKLLLSLPRLQRSLLRALFSSEQAEERVRMLARAVRLLTEDGLAELLASLFQRSKEADGPFRSSLARFAAQAIDRPVFYARLISANLDGQPFDLEELASSSMRERDATASSIDAVEWDARSLKSLLANRLRFSVAPRAGQQSITDESSIADELSIAGKQIIAVEQTIPDLLHKLLTTYPQDARYFFYALRDTPDMLDALARECTAPLFEQLLGLLCPVGAETLTALIHSHAAIPIPYRQSSEEKLRQVILYELLHLGEGRPLDDSFFVRVLWRLFGTPVPEPVAQHLLRETAAWSASGKLPSMDVETLEKAIKSEAAIESEAVIKSGEARAEDGTPLEVKAAQREQRSVRGQDSPDLRKEVFAFLIGESQTSHGPGEQGVEESSRERKTLSDDTLIHELLLMMDESPGAVAAFVRQHLSGQRVREHWVKILPESALVRLSFLIEPRQHRRLLDSAEVLLSAWLEASPSGALALTDRKIYWSLILEFLARNTEADRSAERFVRAFFEHFAARHRAQSHNDSESRNVGAQLFEHARRLADKAGHSTLLATLQRDRVRLLSTWGHGAARAPAPAQDEIGDKRTSNEVEQQSGKDERQSSEDKRQSSEGRLKPPRRSRVKTAFGLAEEEEEETTGEPLYVDNAGLVLTGPFLPHLFQSLNMLSEDEQGRTRLRDAETISRAVHLLQYLVDGRTSAPEPLLVLNKIICGVPASVPVAREIDLTEEERALCEQLLRAMIANWKIIENTSIAGLQETFLQRAGRLEYTSEGWKLRVQRKTLDVLVDQIPWSISVIYHKWMPQPLYVNW